MSDGSTSGTEQPVHPLERLKQQAKEARKKQEKERVHCPNCGTTVWKDTIEDALKTQEKHDEQRHNGEPTTKINGIVPPDFSEQEKQHIQDVVEKTGVSDG